MLFRELQNMALLAALVAIPLVLAAGFLTDAENEAPSPVAVEQR